MFALDKWQEIWDTISANKLRTVLTGFTVAWGIMMLVILLGSGAGLSNGIEYQFRDWAFNSVIMVGGKTSVPYKGFTTGRSVVFTNRDYEEIKDRVNGVDKASDAIAYRIQSPFPIRVNRRHTMFVLSIPNYLSSRRKLCFKAGLLTCLINGMAERWLSSAMDRLISSSKATAR